MAEAISSTHCTYPRRDGQAEWAWINTGILDPPKVVSSNPCTNLARRSLTSLLSSHPLPCPLEEGPWNPAMGFRSAASSQSGFRVELKPKSNLEQFCLKIWNLVANFKKKLPRINWLKFSHHARGAPSVPPLWSDVIKFPANLRNQTNISHIYRIFYPVSKLLQCL